MKPLIWGVFGLLALCWTGVAAASVQITEWLLTLLAAGETTSTASTAAQWPAPDWLAQWVNPTWLNAMQTAWLGLVQWLGQVVPGAASGLHDWVAPLVWTTWALGLLCLLLPALALHWLAGRLKTATSVRTPPR